ncbi:MAG TPA: hypothetical protein VH684_30235 [Xanthobacteraceae bacterium]
MNYKGDEKPSVLFIRDPAAKSAMALDPEQVAKQFGVRASQMPPPSGRN